MKTRFLRILIKPATAFAIMCGAAMIGTLPFDHTVAAEAPAGISLPLTVDETELPNDTPLTVSFAPVVRKVAPSVVSIFTTKKVRGFNLPDVLPFFDDPMFRRFFGDGLRDGKPARPQLHKERSLGSGVIVTRDGYIITNNHVVDGADEIKVALADEKRQFTARVIGGDSHTDIALLKIDTSDLPAITLTNSDKLEVGDVVLAAGNPFGVGQSVSHGIVSAVGRGGLGIEAYEDFIQTDAPINPGNSGGALVDARGRLVGINTAIATRSGASAGVGFAVPVNMAREVMEKLLRKGKVVRGFMGVGIQDLTPELAKEFGAPDAGGALVGHVESGGAASDAGIKSGDIIIEFNGQRVIDSRQLRLIVAATEPGTRAEVRVLREGKPQTFTVTLKELPVSLSARGDGGPGESRDEVLRDVEVTDLTPALRRQFDIPGNVEGALVSDVAADSAAQEAGLRSGDVIMEINRKPVHNAREAMEATRAVPERRVLLKVWSQGASRFLVVDEGRNQ